MKYVRDILIGPNKPDLKNVGWVDLEKSPKLKFFINGKWTSLTSESTEPADLPTATDKILGGVKIGSSIVINDGVIDVNTGDGLRVDGGKLALSTATHNKLGGVIIGSSVDSGGLTLNTSTGKLSVFYGDGLFIDELGRLCVIGDGSGGALPTASDKTLGGVKIPLNSGLLMQGSDLKLNIGSIDEDKNLKDTFFVPLSLSTKTIPNYGAGIFLNNRNDGFGIENTLDCTKISLNLGTNESYGLQNKIAPIIFGSVLDAAKEAPFRSKKDGLGIPLNLNGYLTWDNSENFGLDLNINKVTEYLSENRSSIVDLGTINEGYEDSETIKEVKDTGIYKFKADDGRSINDYILICTFNDKYNQCYQCIIDSHEMTIYNRYVYYTQEGEVDYADDWYNFHALASEEEYGDVRLGTVNEINSGITLIPISNLKDLDNYGDKTDGIGFRADKNSFTFVNGELTLKSDVPVIDTNSSTEPIELDFSLPKFITIGTNFKQWDNTFLMVENTAYFADLKTLWEKDALGYYKVHCASLQSFEGRNIDFTANVYPSNSDDSFREMSGFILGTNYMAFKEGTTASIQFLRSYDTYNTEKGVYYTSLGTGYDNIRQTSSDIFTPI